MIMHPSCIKAFLMAAVLVCIHVQDGTIAEAVVWEASSAQRHLIADWCAPPEGCYTAVCLVAALQLMLQDQPVVPTAQRQSEYYCTSKLHLQSMHVSMETEGNIIN